MIIEMTRGDTLHIAFKMVDTNGNDFIFEDGDIVTFSVRTVPSANPILVQSIATFVEDNTKALIKINPSDTEMLKFRDYRYDVEFRRPIEGEEDFVYTAIKPDIFRVGAEVTYDY